MSHICAIINVNLDISVPGHRPRFSASGNTPPPYAPYKFTRVRVVVEKLPDPSLGQHGRLSRPTHISDVMAGLVDRIGRGTPLSCSALDRFTATCDLEVGIPRGAAGNCPAAMPYRVLPRREPNEVGCGPECRKPWPQQVRRPWLRLSRRRTPSPEGELDKLGADDAKGFKRRQPPTPASSADAGARALPSGRIGARGFMLRLHLRGTRLSRRRMRHLAF